MAGATTIDKQITHYLNRLNQQQKKAVLTVVKTFADGQEEYDTLEDEAFLDELDERTAGYENGTAVLYTVDELEIIARNTYKAEKINGK